MVKTVFWGAAVGLALAASPVWAQLKIGVVNYSQLMQESPQAKTVTEQLRAEFMPRQRDYQSKQDAFKKRQDELQKNAATMSDEQRDEAEKEMRDRDRDLQNMKQEITDDFNARRNEEISRMQKTLIEQVRIYAKAQNFDLVLADGVIYATNALDITPAILARLQQAAHPAGEANSATGAGSGDH